MDAETIEQPERLPLKNRLARVLDRAEVAYLKVLRAAILIIATGLVCYALVLAVFSVYRVAQSPDSVQEEAATVAPEELTSAESAPGRPSSQTNQSRLNPAQRRSYDLFLTQYYQLYRARFEPFRQTDDQPLGRAEFDDRFVGVQTRLGAIGRGDLNFETDLADLQGLLRVMSDAAALPATQQRLRRYKAAHKVQVCQNVERMRSTVTIGWDTLSMSCPNWYENGGCSVPRTIQTPFTARECSMRFPEGTQSHAQIFRAYQDRFFSLLTERRTANAARAQTERETIVEGISIGKTNLWTALTLAAGFLILMFFFLLIAIERHQRRLARESEEQELTA
jgi:TRAP-type C4-dicarboxylate transport system permease small subunit